LDGSLGVCHEWRFDGRLGLFVLASSLNARSCGAASVHESVRELARGVVDQHAKLRLLGAEIVVEPDSNNRDSKPNSRRQQGFGDTSGDRCQTPTAALARVGHQLEGCDDAEHGAEQPHEGCR
jgi:hypothetical protein